MSITSKILEIQKRIEVQKTGYNEKHGFTFFREEDVVNAVREELNAHGIIVRQTVEDYRHEAIYDTNGRYRPRASAVVHFQFIEVESGETFDVSVGAEGSGTGDDVSSRKLATQARKIAFLQTFQIGEGSDRYDSDSQGEQEPIATVAPASKGQNTAELVAWVGDQIRDENSPIDADIVNKVGSRIAVELGLQPKGWNNEGAVLEKLVAALKAGEVE